MNSLIKISIDWSERYVFFFLLFVYLMVFKILIIFVVVFDDHHRKIKFLNLDHCISGINKSIDWFCDRCRLHLFWMQFFFYKEYLYIYKKSCFNFLILNLVEFYVYGLAVLYKALAMWKIKSCVDRWPI